jgi:hypothetical protein
MTTDNHVDHEPGEPNELRPEDLAQVAGGVIITKYVDKASPAILSTMGMGGGTPSLEYWLGQLMF